jgi:tetratricopeptide (TPR) repeat protein
MRAYVLGDARLSKLAGRFVWLDVDTEQPRNVPFLERFPIEVWPTLLVVDPATERVVRRWAGTATAAQIEKLAADGERAVRAARGPAADEALARADRLAAARRPAEAAAAYREALAQGGRAWSGRERAAESLVQTLGLGGDAPACAAAAADVLPVVAPGARRARIAAQGLACARVLDGAAARGTALDALEPAALAALAAPGVLADDRSWLYDELSQAREARGDPAGAAAVARRWLAFLEGEAARAPTPLARSAFDGPRLSAAIRIGEPERARAALERSEKDLPREFVPPQLLAVLDLEVGRPADALAAARRALPKAEGPRRVRILVLEAQALTALGRKDGARATLEEAIRTGEAMPEATRPAGYVKRARKLLQDLGG